MQQHQPQWHPAPALTKYFCRDSLKSIINNKSNSLFSRSLVYSFFFYLCKSTLVLPHSAFRIVCFFSHLKAMTQWPNWLSLMRHRCNFVCSRNRSRTLLLCCLYVCVFHSPFFCNLVVFDFSHFPKRESIPIQSLFVLNFPFFSLFLLRFPSLLTRSKLPWIQTKCKTCCRVPLPLPLR